jgi:hypothetical protein
MKDSIRSTTLEIPLGLKTDTTENFILDFLSLCARTYGFDLSVGDLRKRLTEKGFKRLWDNAILHPLLKDPVAKAEQESK